MPYSPIRQVAYFVEDIRAAARVHHAGFGSGPYFISENIPLDRCIHRGEESRLDHSSAYGQWGDVMIEFVQQNNPGASVFHDLFPEGSGRKGLHHMAIFVDDLANSIADLDRAGFAMAMEAQVAGGISFAMIDMVATSGHMLELYEQSKVLLDFYAMVAESAGEFTDGVLRTLS
jgi:hypothetical protein